MNDAIVVVAKPAGITSHDVVARLRRIMATRKVGHAGTLDPMATGVLIAGVNRATRLLTYLVGLDKVYRATIRLGETTTTDDAQGETVSRATASGIAPAEVNAGIARLTGTISQVPSAVSAIKVDGVRAHARVRAGEQVELAAREVTVTRFDLLATRQVGEFLDLDVEVECSSGTYVRALARDLGGDLGVGGHLTALQRTRVGPFTIDEAATLEDLAQDAGSRPDGDRPGLLGAGEAAARLFPMRHLDVGEVRELSFGRSLSSGPSPAQPIAALTPTGELAALLADDGQRARPLAVFL